MSPRTETPTRPTPDEQQQAGAAPFTPHPGAPRWYVREVVRIMSLLSAPPTDESADGWHVFPWDDGVAVQRIQDQRHHLRPGRAGRVRDRWDEAIRADRAHLAAHGLEIVLAGSSQTVVRVPAPAAAQTVARLRRTGPVEEFARSVTFEGYDQVGGTVRLAANFASCRHVVTDHQGDDVPVGSADEAGAVEWLAHHYGLPTPVRVVHESAHPSEDGSEPGRIAITPTGWTREPDPEAASEQQGDGQDGTEPYVPVPVPAGLTDQAGADGRIPLWCAVQARRPGKRWRTVRNGTSVQNLHDAAQEAAADDGEARVVIDMTREVLATYQRPAADVVAREAIARAQRLADSWVTLTEIPEPTLAQRDDMKEAFRIAERAADRAEQAVSSLDLVPWDVRRAHQAADYLAQLFG